MKKELKAVKKVICVPQKWMKGDYNNGKGRYCLLGAIEKVGYLPTIQPFLENLLPDKNIAIFNDAKSTKHKDVMKLLNKAIRMAQ